MRSANRSERTAGLAERYRLLNLLCLAPTVLLGVVSTGRGFWLAYEGRFMLGMVVTLLGLAMLSGAFVVATADITRAFRGVAVAACGALGLVALLIMGKLWGKLDFKTLLVLAVLYAVTPLVLLGAYALGSALAAYRGGERDPTRLRQIPRTTFASVERGTTYVVEVALFVILVVLLNWSKAQPGHFKRHDWSSLKPGERVFALSSKSKKVLKNLKKDVKVIVLMTPPATEDQDSIYEDVKELLTRFSARSRHIKVEYIDLHRQLARAQMLVKKYRLNLSEAVDLESGVGGLVVFVSGDKQKYVNSNEMVDYEYERGPAGRPIRKVSGFKGEQAFLNALLNVTQTAQLRICFTQGHGEPAIDSPKPLGLLYAAEALKRENFLVETIDKKLEQRVPRRCDMVVAAGARVVFSDREKAALAQYLKEGGKLFYIAATAEGVGSTVRFVHTGLESLLAQYGIDVQDAFALDLSIRAAQNPLIWIPEKTWGDHPITQVMQGKRLVLELPRVIRAKKDSKKTVEVTELLTTSSGEHAWGERDLGFIQDPRATPAFKAGEDLKSPVSIAVAAREKKKGGARLVAFGSFVSFTNSHINPNMPMQDYSVDFLLNVVNWLGHKEQMIAIQPRTPEQIKLELRADQVNRIFRVTVFAMPMMAILLGLLVWWVRRS
jgi:hypothetical protein